MSGNGRSPAVEADGAVLRWPGRVLSADDVRRRVNGHRRLLLPRSAVVTPLAAEELSRNGVEWDREEDTPQRTASRFGYAQDRNYPLVGSAVRTLARDGVAVRELAAPGDDLA